MCRVTWILPEGFRGILLGTWVLIPRQSLLRKVNQFIFPTRNSKQNRTQWVVFTGALGQGVTIPFFSSIAVATISFWACGFAFAIGDGTTTSSNFFFSHTRFFLMNATEKDFNQCANSVVVLMFVIVIMNSGFISRLRCWIYPILVTLVAGESCLQYKY